MTTVVGLFDDYGEADCACSSLLSAGFPRDDIGLLACEQAWDRTHPNDALDEAEGIRGLLVGVGAIAVAGIGPIVAVGPILTTLVGAAGGIFGALTQSGIPDEHAGYYAEAVRRGGTLVLVRASDDLAPSAADILENEGAVDVEKRADVWRQRGFRAYDPGAAALTAEEILRERASLPVAQRLEGTAIETGRVHVYPDTAARVGERRAEVRHP